MEFLKRTWAEISMPAFEHNMNEIFAKIPANTKVMAVVKANAYGHGVEVICKKLETLGVKYFAVSNLNEAIEVRKICPDSEILILGYTSPQYSQLLEQYDIMQAIVSKDFAKMLSASAKKEIKCHVAIDTGMGRIGLKNDTPEETAKEIEEICEMPNINVDGIFTHFAVADTDNEECNEYTDKQTNFIVKVAHILKDNGTELRHVHFMNSAGLIKHTNPESTLARAGIIMYGLEPNYPEKIGIDLQPVMTIKSLISHVKTIKPGDSVSYGRTYIAKEERKIATIVAGYADGYPRLLSNKGYILVHGTKCPIVGRVCMDQFMVDVTNVPGGVHADDEVTLVGKDGNEEITADELANLIGTIGYEFVCNISKRVPRIIKY